MVVLKKVKASTLMETLVATVLIVAVFMIASLILNNLFSNSIKNNTNAIHNRLNELEYNIIHDNIQLPYKEDFDSWIIYIDSYKKNNESIIELEATQVDTKKEIIKTIYGNK